MAFIRVSDFDGVHGAIGDLPPQAIPPNIFTDVLNARFRDGVVAKCKGFISQHGTPPIAPQHILVAKDNESIVRAFISGADRIYSLSQGTYVDVSRIGGYTPVAGNSWNGTVLHGVAILNNGSDPPQAWSAAQGKFIDLPNWPADTIARVVRSVDNFLVAIDVTRNGVRYPHNVLWSHPAEPGAVPLSWNISDPTKDAGETPLSKTSGFVVDALPLGSALVIYKENSCYLMQHVGGNFVFRFSLASSSVGMLARNCAQEFKNRHLVLTQDDVVLFDGRTYESIMERRWRSDLFRNLSGVDYEKCFVAAMPHLKEYWICIPTVEGQPPNIAYVWRPDTNSWSKRELPFVQHIVFDFPPGSGHGDWDSWGDWDSSHGGWSPFVGRGRIAIAASPTNGKLFTVEESNTIDGTPMVAYAKHESYDFPDPNVPDSQFRVKHLSKIRPRVKAPAGTQLQFFVGTQMHIDDPISWKPMQIFAVGSTDELCWTANGRYISWAVRSDTDCEWELEALEFLVHYGGLY